MRSSACSVVRCSSVFALSVGLSVLLGCRGDSPKSFGTTVPVKGKVTYNGKALPPGCTIAFFHQEKSFPASAVIEADGSYTLLFNGKPAVPMGTYNVSVNPPAATAAETASADPSNPEAYKASMMKSSAKPTAAAGKPAFPKRYSVAETSQVKFTVVEGPTTYDLDMKD